MCDRCRRLIFFCIGLAIGLPLNAIAPNALVAQSLDQKHPNILFIFTDDQAPWALGASGDPHALTPHLDQLFRQGAYLKNAFTVTPVCSPSRVSLLTGRYGTEMGITDWLNPRVEPEAGLAPGTPSWVQSLQQTGYRTGLVGKWHLGLTDAMHPTQFGYDYFMGFRGGGSKPANPTLEKDGTNRKFEGLTPDLLTDHAIEFIAGSKQQPFCLSLHFRAPHAKWLPVAEEDWSPFESLDPSIPNPDYPGLDVARVKRMTREYLASVHSVDRNVGRVLQTLDELHLSDRTIVIFSSDHGYNMGHNGIWHKGNGHWVVKEPPAGTENIPKGQRPNMYDHSIRVPTAIRWPGVIEPGTELTQTFSNLDWFPTLLEMAGIDVPKGVPLRGTSFVPVLQGKSVDWDNGFYGEYSTKHQSRTHMRMYRTPQWKLIRDFRNPGRDELYDLVNDPNESHNLIASESPKLKQVMAELDGKIRANMKAINDPLLDSLQP